MSLNSAHLDAFLALARARSFTRAARELHVTQSALSQRVARLEDELETSLFVRDRQGARLTEAGTVLLRYCESREMLEQEAIARLRPGAGALAGALRVAAFSTVHRSVALPTLATLARKNPDLRLEARSAEVRDLAGLLKRGEADLILTPEPPLAAGVESRLLGHEENVLIESGATPKDAPFLDHDADDETTLRFLALNRGKIAPSKTLKRVFLDEIYAILDGVALGYGRAVVPRHLIDGDRRFRVVGGLKPLRVPVSLAWHGQAYLPKVIRAGIEALCAQEVLNPWGRSLI